MSSNVAGGGGLGYAPYQQAPQQGPMQNPYIGQMPMPGMPGQVGGMNGDEMGHEGHGHASLLYKISEQPPNRGAFIKGSLGIDAGDDFNMAAGKGFKGKAGRDPNDNDQAQNNLTKADANHGAWGIPKYVAGTRDKPNYVQGIQAGRAISLLEVMDPAMMEVLIANQNAGRGSVWNGAAYMLGLIDEHDGSATELEGYRDQFMNSEFLDSGESLADIASETKDSKGNNWARTNHASSAIKAHMTAYQQGIPYDEAVKHITDNTVSGAGRIDTIMSSGDNEYASNNQEDTFTGMNGDERGEWKDVAGSEYGPEMLRILMDSHTMGSHLLTQFGNEGAKSKITGNLKLKVGMDVEQRKGKLVEYFMNNEDDPGHGKTAKKGPFRYTPMQSPMQHGTGQYPQYDMPQQYPGQVGGEYGYPAPKGGQVGGAYGGYPTQKGGYPTQAGGHAHGGGEVGGAMGGGAVGGAMGGGAMQMPPTKYGSMGGGAVGGAMGGGAGAPQTALGGGCNMDHSAGAGLVAGASGGGAMAPGAVGGVAGGGAVAPAAAPAVAPVVGGGPADIGSLAAVLQNLVTVLQQVVAALSASGVGGVSGGGAPGKSPVQGPYQGPNQYAAYTTQQGPPQVPATGHAHN